MSFTSFHSLCKDERDAPKKPIWVHFDRTSCGHRDYCHSRCAAAAGSSTSAGSGTPFFVQEQSEADCLGVAQLSRLAFHIPAGADEASQPMVLWGQLASCNPSANGTGQHLSTSRPKCGSELRGQRLRIPRRSGSVSYRGYHPLPVPIQYSSAYGYKRIKQSAAGHGASLCWYFRSDRNCWWDATYYRLWRSGSWKRNSGHQPTLKNSRHH